MGEFMTVGRILEVKGYGLETARPDTSIAAIVQQLHQHNIGAVVVTDSKQRLLGILSERDIVRALAEQGRSVLKQRASDLMTARVVTAGEDESASDIMRLMTEGKFRHVPIMREGHLVGLVSIGDLVKHRISQLENEAEAFRAYIMAA